MCHGRSLNPSGEGSHRGPRLSTYSTDQEQKSRITPRATPAVTPRATGGIEACWPRPRGSRGSRPATRCVPAAGHLMGTSKKWEGPEGAAAQRNPQPRKPSCTHPWATGCPAVTPRGAGHGPCHHPSPGWQRAGQPRIGGGTARELGSRLAGACARCTGAQAGALPRPARGATATCGRSHAAPLPAGGSGARRGRPQAQPPPPGRPGRAATAPAPPAGILTRQPAGRAGTSSPRGTRPQQRRRRPRAPLRRSRSSPRLPAAAPSRPQVRPPRRCPRPAMLPELRNKLSAQSPSRCRLLPAELPLSRSGDSNSTRPPLTLGPGGGRRPRRSPAPPRTPSPSSDSHGAALADPQLSVRAAAVRPPPSPPLLPRP